ncbi:MAG: hypothetical protein JNK05_36855 [Myxococcales bacterium]|nr:hypothetical protein [Myxococcales bacterium]
MESNPRLAQARRVGALFATVASLTATNALAQASDAELAARRTLIEQATTARTSGDPARALDLAQRAGRIQMTPSLRMFIAETLAAMGNHAAAIGAADRCTQEADRDAAASNRVQIIAACRAIATNARSHVGYVTVTVRGAASPSVSINDTELSDALIGVPFVVNAGAVRVRARAAGYSDALRELSVAAGATVPVEIALERASSASPNPSAVDRSTPNPSNTPSGLGARTPASPGPGASNTDRSDGRRAPVGAIALMATSAAPLGASLGFFLARNGAIAGCAVYPTYIECPTVEQRDAARGANTFAILSGVALGVGVAAIVGGAVWLGVGLAAPPRREAPSVAPVAFNIGADGFAIGAAGRF